MPKKTPPIIPIFLPQRACPERCIYCNQRVATGATTTPTPAEVGDHIQQILNNSAESYQIALYGGSVSALPVEELEGYLQAIRSNKPADRILGIRISTRPDTVSSEMIELFRRYRVETVELGVQSLDDEVLVRIKRGHDAKSVRQATERLQKADIRVGHHLMLGLPGQSADSFARTVQETIELKPTTVRLHPTLVLEDTELAEMWQRGEYIPMELEQATADCARAYSRFYDSSISVIRLGVQETETLAAGVLAGPHHPAFGELVVSRWLRELVEKAIKAQKPKNKCIKLLVAPKALSLFIGQKRCNVHFFKEELGLDIDIAPCQSMEDYEFQLA